MFSFIVWKHNTAKNGIFNLRKTVSIIHALLFYLFYCFLFVKPFILISCTVFIYLLYLSFTVFVNYILLSVYIVYCVCTYVLLSACEQNKISIYIFNFLKLHIKFFLKFFKVKSMLFAIYVSF